MKRDRSRALFKEAQNLIPGGVNSPVRAYGAVGGDPAFLAKGKGAQVWDADGRKYLDYVGSWGPLILGHAAAPVLAAIRKSAALGTTFGAPTEAEVDLADLIRKAMPSLEQIRLVSSGTEAAMSALRLARAATGRNLVLKFDGGYHGHADSFLVKAGSGVETLGLPDSPGVPHELARLTLTLPYNDPAAVDRIFRGKGSQIAAVIVEPVGGNMGVLPPKEGFLADLRRQCQNSGSILIFDEVITGFRVGPGGAQGLYGVKPDLTVLGKIIGGGLPLAAYGGRKDLMRMIAPSGPVYQAGTLSGNPLAVAAGIAVLTALSKNGTYAKLETLGARLQAGLLEAAKECGVPLSVNRVGSMLTPFFHQGPVWNAADARASDREAFKRFFWAMQEKGIMMAPSPFEAWFLSLAHGTKDVDLTIAAAREVFRNLGPSKGKAKKGG